MFSLGQKLKCLIKCEKHINKHTRVVLCKKTTGQNTKYSRNEMILKLGNLAKAIAHPETIAFAKWAVWVKN